MGKKRACQRAEKVKSCIEDFAVGDYLDHKDENGKLHFCLFLSLTEDVDLLLMVIKTALKNGF